MCVYVDICVCLCLFVWLCFLSTCPLSNALSISCDCPTLVAARNCPERLYSVGYTARKNHHPPPPLCPPLLPQARAPLRCAKIAPLLCDGTKQISALARLVVCVHAAPPLGREKDYIRPSQTYAVERPQKQPKDEGEDPAALLVGDANEA